MAEILSKGEIIHQIRAVAMEFVGFCSRIPSDKFFFQPPEKWSIAQDVKHLITATNSSLLAFSLPKFIVRLYAGRPNRASRTYDELVAKYKSKLEQGGRASGRYIPKKISPGTRKEILLVRFGASMNKHADIVLDNWEDPQLDQYIAPHPLLGKITLRELCYFTIYHTRHHLAIVQQKAGAHLSSVPD